MARKRMPGWIFVVLLLVAGGLWWALRSNGEPSVAGDTARAGEGAPTPSAEGTERAPEPTREREVPMPAVHSRLVPATHTEDRAATAGAFEGRVVSATTGEGVEGAELIFSGRAGATSTFTEARGRFRFVPQTEGTWQLAGVTARGYQPFGPDWGQSPLHFTAERGQRISDIVLALTPEVELRGTVVDAKGQPVGGAQVRVLTGQGGGSVLFPTQDRYTTDTRGEFVFRAPEAALVEASHPDHAPARAMVSATVWMTRRVVLKLGRREGTAVRTPGQPLAGRVVDEAGQAVAGARVTLASAESAWPKQYLDEQGDETVTDAGGRFGFKELGPGAYDVEARRIGLAPGELRDVAPGRTDLVLKLLAGGRVVGTVREGSTGKPLPSFTVAVFVRRGPIRRDLLTQQTFLDARGRYEVVGVPPGDYVVQAAAAGYAPSETRVEVPASAPGGVTADLTLALGGRLEGEVVEEGTELPLENARITVEGAGVGEGALALRYDALTDAQGHFTLAGLPPSELSLVVTADGHHGRILSGLSVRGPNAPPQRITLRRTEEGEEPQMELVGIGAVLAPRDDALVVGEVMAGGGAAEVGLVTGDGIVSINGQKVAGMSFSDSVNRIRGPEGSRVVLGIRRAGPPGAEVPLQDITVTRRRLRQ